MIYYSDMHDLIGHPTHHWTTYMEDMEDVARKWILIKLGHTKSKRILCVIPTLIFKLTCFIMIYIPLPAQARKGQSHFRGLVVRIGVVLCILHFATYRIYFPKYYSVIFIHRLECRIRFRFGIDSRE